MSHIQQKIKLFKFIAYFIDFLIFCSAARIAIIIEHIFHGKPWHTLDQSSLNLFFFPIILIIWMSALLYKERNMLYRTIPVFEIFLNVFKVTVFSTLLIISVDFILKSSSFYRTTIIVFTGLSFFLLLIKRVITKLILSHIRKQGKDVKNILVIGTGKRAHFIVDQFEEHTEYGLVIKGIIDPQSPPSNGKLNDYPILGGLDSIHLNLRELPIDEVFFATKLELIDNFEEIINFLTDMGINYHIIVNIEPFIMNPNSVRVKPMLEEYYGLPTVSFHSINSSLYSLAVKNFIERNIAILLLLFFSPIIVSLMVLIKLTSKGNVIFSQERIGLRGRKFNQFKLRSMVQDADSIKMELDHLNEHSGPVFKITNDPRVTKIGKFLRKYSLDELPQLLNVIFGDMNLIGPRPPVPTEVNQYTPKQYRRLSMKPGITGLWQVSGRNNIKSFEDWVKLDLKYIDNWSLFLDLKIAFKTIPVILSGSGK